MDDTPNTWTGTWINEYGSLLRITDERDGHVAGTFTTALDDSSFARTTVPVTGLSKGRALHVAFVTAGEPAAIASFTGLLRADLLHLAWHVVSDRAVESPRPGAAPVEIELPWAHAVLANTDTFRRRD
jgi:hypothetical protein